MPCDRCGFDNPAGFRFCGACGARLQSQEELGHAQERKIISALFCDLVDSTRQAANLDPEAVHRVLAPYFDRVRVELTRLGGTVEKFIGDAVCGFFGAPRTHGDDPERAVRAALAVVEWIAYRNESDVGTELHVRLGVATGEALVALGALSGAGEAMAWGDVTNSAFRIQAAAPVDGVLVDEATYRATRHVIDYGEAEPVQAKGKPDPILVWRALAPRARRGVGLSHADREPFVGRADDLLRLQASLDRVSRERVPELVTLVGEPGIGKTRLVFELFRSLELSPTVVLWRQARSSPYGDGFTFWALGEIIKAQAGILETDGATAASDKLARAVREVVPAPADAAGLEAQLRSLVGLDTPEVHGDRRHAAFAAWRRFLEAVAQEHPLVLVFEDIHCADGGLLDFIEYLLEWARDVRIFIICTARTAALAEARPDWGRNALGVRRELPTTIELWPLSRQETGRLVAMLAGGGIPKETRTAIVGAASGNPLYAVEYVRMLEDRPGEVLGVPETVQAIIASRLDSLSARDKALLQDGAVVGRVVWPGALAAIGGRSKASVDRHLRELARKEFLIRVRPSSVGGESEFRFRHALVRDVAYEQIPHARRGETHRRTAEWLEALSPDRTNDRVEMLALHYLSAYELARAAGGDTGELSDRARLSLRDAGTRALSLNAFPAAERYFFAALDLWPEQDLELPSLLLRLGQARYYANTEGADVLADAERMFLAAGDQESAAEAATFLADLAHQRGEPLDIVFEHAQRALALVDDRELSHAKVEVLVELALFLGLAAEHERAIAIAAQALVDAEALDLEELQARALATRGISRGLSGDLGGREDLELSIEIVERIDSSLSSLHCGMLADLEGGLGNLARCFELQEQARGHAQRFGHASHIQWFRAERVAECYWSGRWDEALSIADEIAGGSDGDVVARHFMEGYCRDMRGRIRLARNDLAGALEDAVEALSQARGSNEPQMLYPALALCAHALAAAGEHDEAARLADELLAEWRSKLNQFPASSWVVDLACALELLGREVELAEAATGALHRSVWLDAAISFAHGEFEVASELFAAIGSRPDEALARLRAAETLAATGRDTDASVELDRARSFFRDVGAAGYLARADDVRAARRTRL